MKDSKKVILAKIEITEQDGKPVEYHIGFCKADGSLRKMCIMNHVKHKQGNDERSEGARFKYNLKEKNALLLFNADLELSQVIYVDKILFLNGKSFLKGTEEITKTILY